MGKYDDLIQAHNEQRDRDAELYSETLENIREMMLDEERVVDLFANADKAILDIDASFRKATKLDKTDVRFLMVATALQIVRWVVVTIINREVSQKLSDSRVEHNDKSIENMEKEKRQEFKKKHEEKYGHTKSKAHRDWTNIVFDGVPYDTSVGSKAFGVNMEGRYHRIHTLGHDPLLGWVFGTMNILSDTIILDKAYAFRTFDIDMKRKRWISESNAVAAFKDAIDSIQEDEKRLVAALFAQGLHLKSDEYTKLGLPIPVLEVFNPELAGKLYKEGYDTLCLVKDIAVVGIQAVTAIVINMIIAGMHGLFYDPEKYKSRDLYEVKTRKILSISNAIATASNVIWVGGNAWMGNEKAWADLDVGGMLVTAYRLVTDIRFISRVQKEYLENEWLSMAVGSEYRFTLEADMSKKDIEKGIEIQAEADARVHRKVAAGLAQQADALEQIKDSQQDMHEIVGTMLEDLKGMQAQLKYGIEPGRKPKDLGDGEKQVLCSALYTLMESEGDTNELQRDFFLSVEQHVGATKRDGGFDFNKLANIDSHSDRMVVLAALCSFLFLKTNDFSFLEDEAYSWLRYFAVDKDLEYVREVIEREYAIVGAEGIASRYCTVQETPEAEPEHECVEEADSESEEVDDEILDESFDELQEIILSFVKDEQAFGKNRNDSPQQALKEILKQFPKLEPSACISISRVESGYLLFTTHAFYLKAEPAPKNSYARIPYSSICVNELASELGKVKDTRKLIIPVSVDGGEKVSYVVDNTKIEEERLRDLIKAIHESGCAIAETDFSIDMSELDEDEQVLYFKALGNIMLRSGYPLTELYLIMADYGLNDRWDSISDGFKDDDALDDYVSEFLNGIPYPSKDVISMQAVVLALQTVCRTNVINGSSASAIPDEVEQLIGKFDTCGITSERFNEMLGAAAANQRTVNLNELYALRERLPEGTSYREMIEAGIPGLEAIAEQTIQEAKDDGNPLFGLMQNIGGFFAGLAGAKNERLKLPEEYQPLDKKPPIGLGIPKDAEGFGMRTESASALLVSYPVSEEQSMPFDDDQRIIDELHATLGEKEGIIEVKSGTTAAGRPFVYEILKHYEEEFMGVDYILNINIRMEKSIQFINGSFSEEGITGLRDNTVYAMLRSAVDAKPDDNEAYLDAIENWSVDPYDPEFKKGFLMNRSEREGADEMFPQHPLSEARRLVRYIVDNN